MTESAKPNPDRDEQAPGHSADRAGALKRLHIAATPVEQLSHRNRTNMACALRACLSALGLGGQDAVVVATAAAHAEPEMWLGRGEVLKSLQRMGVHFRAKKLYRLARKAAESEDGMITVHVAKSGRYAAPGRMLTPVAELIVRRQGEGPVGFRVQAVRVTHNSPDCPPLGLAAKSV